VPERYVRPPLIAREAPSQRLAVWRFRVLALMLLTVLVVALVMVLINLLGIGNEDPGFTGGLRVVSLGRAAG
jgi:hypothetical protein